MVGDGAAAACLIIAARAKAATRQGLIVGTAIIHNLHAAPRSAMEAEQINALANTLADLTDRAAQLRRYL